MEDMSYSSYASLTTAESYKILGLSPGASPTEIKAAYRKLSKEYHPDKAQDDRHASTKFSRIREAFEVVTGKLQPVDKNPRKAARPPQPRRDPVPRPRARPSSNPRGERPSGYESREQNPFRDEEAQDGRYYHSRDRYNPPPRGRPRAQSFSSSRRQPQPRPRDENEYYFSDNGYGPPHGHGPPTYASSSRRPPPRDGGDYCSSEYDRRRRPPPCSQRRTPPEHQRYHQATPHRGQRRPVPPPPRGSSGRSRYGRDHGYDAYEDNDDDQDRSPQGPHEMVDAAEEDLNEMLADLADLGARRRAMLRNMLSWTPGAFDGELVPHTARLGKRLDALRSDVMVGKRFVQLARREPSGVPPPDKVHIVEGQVRRCDADIDQYTVDLDGLEQICQRGLDCQDEYERKELLGDLMIALSSCR